MPLAVTHVLSTIIVLDIFRDYILKNKKLIPLNYLFLGGVAGLLPDIDIFMFWIASLFTSSALWVHGTITHIFLIPLIIAIIGYLTFKKNKKIGILLYIISFGYAFHVLLDFIFYGTNLSPFWPFFITPFKGIVSYINFPRLEMGLDAIILLGWLWHEEVKHKIKDFI